MVRSTKQTWYFLFTSPRQLYDSVVHVTLMQLYSRSYATKDGAWPSLAVINFVIVLNLDPGIFCILYYFLIWQHWIFHDLSSQEHLYFNNEALKEARSYFSSLTNCNKNNPRVLFDTINSIVSPPLQEEMLIILIQG